MFACRFVFLLALPGVQAASSECLGDAATEADEACHLQIGQQQQQHEPMPGSVVILDRKIKDHWGYTSSWKSGETSEWVYSDPCGKTQGLSWHAELPYVNGITLQCLKSAGCHDQFKPQDHGGYKYINMKIYVPPASQGGWCNGDGFGQDLSSSLLLQLFGEDKKIHSKPMRMKRSENIIKSEDGMYWICQEVPHVQQDPAHGEWARLSVQNWPMDTASHEGTFEIYLDYVSLANTCFSA